METFIIINLSSDKEHRFDILGRKRFVKINEAIRYLYRKWLPHLTLTLMDADTQAPILYVNDRGGIYVWSDEMILKFIGNIKNQ